MSKRDFAIDLIGMNYGFDSDEIDALEKQYRKRGRQLKTKQDYIDAFVVNIKRIPMMPIADTRGIEDK